MSYLFCSGCQNGEVRPVPYLLPTRKCIFTKGVDCVPEVYVRSCSEDVRAAFPQCFASCPKRGSLPSTCESSFYQNSWLPPEVVYSSVLVYRLIDQFLLFEASLMIQRGFGLCLVAP